MDPGSLSFCKPANTGNQRLLCVKSGHSYYSQFL